MAKERVALLIATDTYADDGFTNLRTPCTDATALAHLLGDPDVGAFRVTTLLNRPAQEVRHVLDEIFSDAHRDDLVLLHVSGHGVKDESGRLHLVMADTTRRRLRATAIAATWVRELIDHTAARRVVVWLDCCFSGAFPPGFTPKGDETVDAIDQLSGGSGRGCAVMTASTRLQYAFEQGDASVFTEAITDGLRTGAADLNEDGYVDASELYAYVHDWVRARTPDQTPTRNDMLSGDFRIALNRRIRPLPDGIAPEIRQLLRSADPRFREMGIRELKELADYGDEIARSALAVVGEHPATEEPAAEPGEEPAAPFTATGDFLGITHLKAKWVTDRSTLTCMAFNPVRRNTMCVGVDGTVQHLSASFFTPLSQIAHTGLAEVRALAFSPDGRQVVSATDGELMWWKVCSRFASRRTNPGATALAFRPDGEQLALAPVAEHGASGMPGEIRYDVKLMATDRSSHVVFQGAHTGWIRDLAYRGDGSLLASAGVDGVVQLWDPRNRTNAGQLTVHDGTTWSIAFSPDGELLATAGAADAVRLWHVGTARPVRSLSGHGHGALSVAFSPDGRELVTGGADGGVRFFDLAVGGKPAVLGYFPERVVAVAFDATGDLLVGASERGRLMTWTRV